MAGLEALDDDEAALLVSIAYRVGRLIGDADDREGDQDDIREGAAITAALEQFASGQSGTPFVREIASEALRRRDLWPQWDGRMSGLYEDCTRAVRIIGERLDKTRAKNFRTAMLRIARKVAQAADEFGDFDSEDGRSGALAFVRGLALRLISPSARAKSDLFANVSPAEQAELERLSDALAVKE